MLGLQTYTTIPNLCGAGAQTQCLMHAMQALYQVNELHSQPHSTLPILWQMCTYLPVTVF